ncbi:MAG: hypothetical protein ACLTJ5_14070 [Clostridium sp.]
MLDNRTSVSCSTWMPAERCCYDRSGVYRELIRSAVVNPREILRLALQCDAAQIDDTA